MRSLWASLQILGHVLAPWRRPWRVRWGARADEPDPSLPGEDLVPDPTWDYTHAVTIHTSADDVWPWIVQMGQGRGGFYTFAGLENVFGCRITNADSILADHQTLEVGDEVRLHPDVPMRVDVVEPGRSIVLGGSLLDEADPTNKNLWAYHLIPDGPNRCRLVERGKTLHGRSLTDRLFFSPLFVEPVGFVMSREMLLGIKERAEGAALSRRRDSTSE